LDAEHSFNGNETRLYFFLLKQSNSLYWKDTLANADGYTAAMVGISVNTLKTCRNRLQQAGLITFKTGGSGPRDKCRYTIMDARVQRDGGRYQKLTPDPQPYPQPYLSPYPQKTDDNYKQKQKKNEREEGAGHQQPTADKKVATLQQRRTDFEHTLQPYAAEYGQQLVTDFLNYWTEPNRTQTRMRWELERTWDTHRRLDNWRRNEDKFDKPKPAPEATADDYLLQRKKQEERTRELSRKS